MTSVAERSEAIALKLAMALPDDEAADVVIAAIASLCAGCIRALPQHAREPKLQALLIAIQFACANPEDREKVMLGLRAVQTVGRG